MERLKEKITKAITHRMGLHKALSPEDIPLVVELALEDLALAPTDLVGALAEMADEGFPTQPDKNPQAHDTLVVVAEAHEVILALYEGVKNPVQGSREPLKALPPYVLEDIKDVLAEEAEQEANENAVPEEARDIVGRLAGRPAPPTSWAWQVALESVLGEFTEEELASAGYMRMEK